MRLNNIQKCFLQYYKYNFIASNLRLRFINRNKDIYEFFRSQIDQLHFFRFLHFNIKTHD